MKKQDDNLAEQKLNMNELFQDIDREQEKLESILHALVRRNYDYILRIEAKNGSFKMYSHGNENGYFPMESGLDYDAMCRRYHPLVACAQDRKKLQYCTRLSWVEEQLQEQNRYSFLVRTMNLDGTIAWKRYTYTYLDRMHRILLLTRRDVTKAVIREKERKNELIRAKEEHSLVQREQREFCGHIIQNIQDKLEEITGYCENIMQALDGGRGEGKPKSKVRGQIQIRNCANSIDASADMIRKSLNDMTDIYYLEQDGQKSSEEKEDSLRIKLWIADIKNQLELEAAERGVGFECCLEGNEERNDCLMIDEKLKQAVLSFLRFSIRSTESGGKVRMVAVMQPVKKGLLRIRLAIGNTGRKWTEKEIADLFTLQKDGQGDEVGTGEKLDRLELIIAKKIIEKMRGIIQIRGAICGGLEMEIELTAGTGEAGKEKVRRPV